MNRKLPLTIRLLFITWTGRRTSIKTILEARTVWKLLLLGFFLCCTKLKWNQGRSIIIIFFLVLLVEELFVTQPKRVKIISFHSFSNLFPSPKNFCSTLLIMVKEPEEDCKIKHESILFHEQYM